MTEKNYNSDLKGAKSFSLWLTDFTINLKFYTYVLTLSAILGLIFTLLLIIFKEDWFVKAHALTMFIKTIFAGKTIYIQDIHANVSTTEARKFYLKLIEEDKFLVAKILATYIISFFVTFLVSYKLLAKKVTKHTQEFQKPEFLRGTNIIDVEKYAELQGKRKIEGIVLTDLETEEVKKQLEEVKNAK